MEAQTFLYYIFTTTCHGTWLYSQATALEYSFIGHSIKIIELAHLLFVCLLAFILLSHNTYQILIGSGDPCSLDSTESICFPQQLLGREEGMKSYIFTEENNFLV